VLDLCPTSQLTGGVVQEWPTTKCGGRNLCWVGGVVANDTPMTKLGGNNGSGGGRGSGPARVNLDGYLCFGSLTCGAPLILVLSALSGSTRLTPKAWGWLSSARRLSIIFMSYIPYCLEGARGPQREML
jgi:hypothetical protein